MRLLYVCHLDPATTDLPLFFGQGLSEAGHKVRFCTWDLDFESLPSHPVWAKLSRGDGWRHPRFVAAVEKACADFRPDVLLQGNRFLLPADLNRIRARFGCKVGFFLGYNHLLEGQTTAILRASDFVIVHDSYVEPLIRGTRMGRNPNVFLLPAFATPAEHFPVTLSPFDVERYGCDVAFIGGASAHRCEVLRRLSRFQVRVWGGWSWQDFGELPASLSTEPVYGLKKTKIYNAARIVLNIEDPDKQVNSLNSRVPETLACGGFAITEWSRDLDDTPLRDGESVACYHSLEELEEKVSYYLEHVDERKAISRRGRELVLAHMTNRHVATKLASEIEGIPC